MLRLRAFASSRGAAQRMYISSLTSSRASQAKTVPVTHTPKLPPKGPPPPKSSSSGIPVVLAGAVVIGLAGTAHSGGFRDQVEDSLPFLRPILNIFHKRPEISPIKPKNKSKDAVVSTEKVDTTTNNDKPAEENRKLNQDEEEVTDLSTLQEELRSIGNANTSTIADSAELSVGEDDNTKTIDVDISTPELETAIDISEEQESLDGTVLQSVSEAEDTVEPGLPLYLSENDPQEESSPVAEENMSDTTNEGNDDQTLETKASDADQSIEPVVDTEVPQAESGSHDSSVDDSSEQPVPEEEVTDNAGTIDSNGTSESTGISESTGTSESTGAIESSETNSTEISNGDAESSGIEKATSREAEFQSVNETETEVAQGSAETTQTQDINDKQPVSGGQTEDSLGPAEEQNSSSYEKSYDETEVQRRITEALNRQREEDAAVHREFLEKQHQLHKLEVEEEVARLQEEFARILERERARLREEKQSEVQQHLLIQEKHHDEDLRTKMANQAKVIMRDNENSFQTRLGHERARRTAVMQQLIVRLNAVEEVISSYKESERRIHAAHSMFLAAHGFEGGKGSSPPSLAQLKRVAEAHEFLESVINAFPNKQLEEGVCSAQDLKSRFQSLQTSLLKVATVNEGDGFGQYLISRAAAAVKLPVKGLVAGDSLEARLARVEHFLEINDIDMATRELNQVTGVHRRLATDWLRDARHHLEVVQALDAARAFVTLSSLSLL